MQSIFPITRPLPYLLDADRPWPSQPATKPSNLWHIFPEIDGRFFALAVESGVFIEISLSAAEILSLPGQSIGTLPSPLRDEVETLFRIGLFAPAPRPHRWPTAVTTLNLNLCHTCNISCSYCFAGKGRYGEHHLSIMSVEVAKRAIDLLLDQTRDQEPANIVLFGGEPLLARRNLKEIISYGRHSAGKKGLEIVFDIFTNGTLLDKEIGELVENDTHVRILLSLDGPPTINDKHRRGFQPAGVAETVRKNLTYMDNVPRERILVRSTVAQLPPRIIERAEYFSGIGLTNMVFDPAFCKGVPDIPPAAALYDAMIDELPDISTYLRLCVRQKKTLSINVLSQLISQILMNNLGALTNYVSPCPAGQKFISIDAAGQVFPCHYFVGHKDYQLGHIKDGLPQLDLIAKNGRADLIREHQDHCRECWLRTICEGPCPYKRLVLYPAESNDQDAYCRYMKARVITSLQFLSSFYRPGCFPYSQQWNALVARCPK